MKGEPCQTTKIAVIPEGDRIVNGDAVIPEGDGIVIGVLERSPKVRKIREGMEIRGRNGNLLCTVELL